MLNNLSPIYHPANHLSTGTENSTRENLMSKMFYNGKSIFNTIHYESRYGIEGALLRVIVIVLQLWHF